MESNLKVKQNYFLKILLCTILVTQLGVLIKLSSMEKKVIIIEHQLTYPDSNRKVRKQRNGNETVRQLIINSR